MPKNIQKKYQKFLYFLSNVKKSIVNFKATYYVLEYDLEDYFERFW